MNPLAETIALLAAMGIPAGSILYLFSRFFRLKEKRLELEVHMAAEKAAQYAAGNAALEARVRVLEKIVTEGGYDLASQIEALRGPAQLPQGDKVQ